MIEKVSFRSKLALFSRVPNLTLEYAICHGLSQIKNFESSKVFLLIFVSATVHQIVELVFELLYRQFFILALLN
jgi:hypothetical protein